MSGDLGTRPLAQTLAETRARFVAALGRADAEALAELYTADATLLPPAAAPISGRQAIRRFWQAGLDAGIVAVRLEPAWLDDDVRLAYEAGSYELELEPAAATAIVEHGNYVLVHSQQGDRWRRRVEIFAPASPRA